MDREIILSRTAEIPVSQLGRISEDHEIWEGNDGAAHFKITRHRLPLPCGEREVLSLSVSGDRPERARIIKEFCEALGEPVERDDMVTLTGIEIDFVLWLSKEGTV